MCLDWLRYRGYFLSSIPGTSLSIAAIPLICCHRLAVSHTAPSWVYLTWCEWMDDSGTTSLIRHRQAGVGCKPPGKSLLTSSRAPHNNSTRALSETPRDRVTSTLDTPISLSTPFLIASTTQGPLWPASHTPAPPAFTPLWPAAKAGSLCLAKWMKWKNESTLKWATTSALSVVAIIPVYTQLWQPSMDLSCVSKVPRSVHVKSSHSVMPSAGQSSPTFQSCTPRHTSSVVQLVDNFLILCWWLTYLALLSLCNPIYWSLKSKRRVEFQADW